MKDEDKILELYRKKFLNKKVIDIQTLLHGANITVRLTFDNGFHLNFTYNKDYLNLGKEIERATIDHDLGMILRGKIET